MQYASRRDYVNACKEYERQQKKFDLAEDDLRKAIELGPKDRRNHYNMACWYSLQGQVSRGLASIDTALSIGQRLRGPA
jgi:Tfp pilus assembly protein PilF